MTARPRVFVSRALPGDPTPASAERIDWDIWERDEAPSPAELRARAASRDGLLSMLTDRIDSALLDACPELRVVSQMAVGYDNIDVAACTARGVAVCNTPGVLTDATADYTFALLLAAARRVVEGDRVVRADGWKAWHPTFMLGRDVSGATLGIVGMGSIGAAVAHRAVGFGMRILYHSRGDHLDVEQTTGARRVPFSTLLSESDFVIALVPLTPETRRLFGAAEFALMKPTAVFVNVARGPVVDEAALVQALRAGRPGSAALDVFEQEPLPSGHPLTALPNVVLSPHLGSASWGARTAMARMAVENAVAALTGAEPRAIVNPETLGGAAHG